MKKITIIMILIFILFSCGKDTDQKANKEAKSNKVKLFDPVSNSEITKSEDSKEEIKDPDKYIDSLAYIDSFEWKVNIFRDNEKIEANESELLYLWDIIATWTWSNTNIIFVDDSIIKLDENSNFEILNIEWDNIDVKLNKWSVWWRIVSPETKTPIPIVNMILT